MRGTVHIQAGCFNYQQLDNFTIQMMSVNLDLDDFRIYLTAFPIFKPDTLGLLVQFVSLVNAFTRMFNTNPRLGLTRQSRRVVEGKWSKSRPPPNHEDGNAG